MWVRDADRSVGPVRLRDQFDRYVRREHAVHDHDPCGAPIFFARSGHEPSFVCLEHLVHKHDAYICAIAAVAELDRIYLCRCCWSGKGDAEGKETNSEFHAN